MESISRKSQIDDISHIATWNSCQKDSQEKRNLGLTLRIETTNQVDKLSQSREQIDLKNKPKNKEALKQKTEQKTEIRKKLRKRTK